MQSAGPIIFFAVVFTFFLFIDWYVFQGIKTLTASWASPVLRQSVHVLYWAICIGLPIFMFLSFQSVQRTHQFTPMAKLALASVITMLVTQTVFVSVLFMEDIYRFGAGLYSYFTVKPEPDHFLPERRKFISQLGIMLAAVPFASFVYGIAKGKYDFTVHRHVLKFPDLPPAFDGFTITQVSDIHSGSFDNIEAVRKGVELIKQQGSDIFFFTGDLVNNLASEFEPYKQMFAEVEAPYGKYSILGNHDYADYVQWPSPEAKQQNMLDMYKNHADAGFKLMLNEHAFIERDGQKLAIVGIENWGKGFAQHGDLDKAMAGLSPDTFKILLSHDPSHFEAQVKDNPNMIHLTLAGHTHGMQMGVELPFLKWSPAKLRYPRWAGVYEVNGRKLNVNRGFGFLAFSGRVGIWPEVTVIELRRG
jgi:predicted MPP superfamily phosphohydrolase